MKVKKTEKTFIELNQTEIDAINNACNIVAEMIKVMRKEYAKGLTDSYDNELHLGNLITTVDSLDELMTLLEDDTLELF